MKTFLNYPQKAGQTVHCDYIKKIQGRLCSDLKLLPYTVVVGQINLLMNLCSFCSTELMRRVRRFQIAQYKCLVIKYAKDTRYSDTGMATHDQ